MPLLKSAFFIAANLAAEHTDWLRDYLITEFAYVKRHPELLASFIEGTELPFP